MYLPHPHALLVCESDNYTSFDYNNYIIHATGYDYVCSYIQAEGLQLYGRIVEFLLITHNYVYTRKIMCM